MMAAALAAVARLIGGATVRSDSDLSVGGQRIYFANHSSHLDFVLIWSALPARLRRLVRPVAGRDYWERGPVRRYLAGRVFHAILIDRGGSGSGHPMAAARESIQRMADGMGDRHSLIVFPEGTRSLTGDVGPFKSGLFHLARLRPDAELMPVYLENLNRILPKGEALPVPMLSRVVFGRRVDWHTDEDKHDFLERARAALIQLKAAR